MIYVCRNNKFEGAWNAEMRPSIGKPFGFCYYTFDEALKQAVDWAYGKLV